MNEPRATQVKMATIPFTDPCTDSEALPQNSGGAERASHKAQPGDRHEGLRNVAHAPSPGNSSGGAFGADDLSAAWQPQPGIDSASTDGRDGEKQAHGDDITVNGGFPWTCGRFASGAPRSNESTTAGSETPTTESSNDGFSRSSKTSEANKPKGPLASSGTGFTPSTKHKLQQVLYHNVSTGARGDVSTGARSVSQSRYRNFFAALDSVFAQSDTLADNEDNDDDDAEQTGESSSSAELATSSTSGSKRAPSPDAIVSVRLSPAKIRCFNSKIDECRKLGQPEDGLSESSQSQVQQPQDDVSESSQSRQISNSEGSESSEEEEQESDSEDTAMAPIRPDARIAQPTPVEAPFTSVHELEVVSRLGGGAYGEVFLVKDIRNVPHCPTQVPPLFALKEMSKDDGDDPCDFEIEVELLQDAQNSPFAVGFHSWFETENAWYIVLEYCNKGTLRDVCQREKQLEPEMARMYIAQLVLAIESLHALDIVHYDLKPDNVLFGREGHVCIADFGFAENEIKPYTSKGTCRGGTTGYMAPEVEDNNREAHGKAVDWYALGVMGLELLTGRGWTDDKFKSQLACLRQEGQLSLSMHKDLSCDAISLLKGLLCENKVLRLGSQGVDAIKRHTFFRGVNWEEVASKTISLEEMALNYDPNELPEEDDVELDEGDDSDTDMEIDSDSDSESECEIESDSEG